MIDCPHCYRLIVPMTDEICPACRRDTTDLAGVDPDRTIVTIDMGEPIPNICMCCGRSCDTYIKFCEDTTREVKVGFFEALFGDSGQRGLSFEASLPVCSSCAREYRPEARHIDIENYRLTFVVHKNFRKAFEELT